MVIVPAAAVKVVAVVVIVDVVIIVLVAGETRRQKALSYKGCNGASRFSSQVIHMIRKISTRDSWLYMVSARIGPVSVYCDWLRW